jgi:hypothetical protein
MGIGYLRNRGNYRKKRRIHSDNNYNRFTYIGHHRVDKNELHEKNLKFLRLLEELVFKGKDHIKRGQGFISIPEKKIKYMKNNILDFLVSIFLNKYL